MPPARRAWTLKANRQGGITMPVRVAINGFGRTGRAAFRAAYERRAPIEWAAINDVAGPEMIAQLLRHDTVYGPLPEAPGRREAHPRRREAGHHLCAGDRSRRHRRPRSEFRRDVRPRAPRD